MKKEYRTSLGHIVKNVTIYPVFLNPGYCPRYNFENPFWISNNMCPTMSIRGEIDGTVYWWARDGKYYKYNRQHKGLLKRTDFIEDPGMRLLLD